MDGVGRAVGAPSHITIDGETYPLRLNFDIIGEVEQWMLEHQLNPLEEARKACEGLPESVQGVLMKEALKLATANRVVQFEDVEKFLSTREGVTVIFWINRRRDGCPEMTYEEAKAMVSKLGEQEIQEVAEAAGKAAGTDELGNSIGPSTSSTKKNSKKNKGELTAAGRES